MGRSIYLFPLSLFLLLLLVQEIILFQNALDLSMGPEKDYRIRGRNLVAQGIDFDLRTPLQVVREERKHGILSYPVVTPQHFLRSEHALNTPHGEIFPLSGISRSRTVFCNENGRYISYQSDRYGFRNPDAIHRKDSMDIVALGDSFVHGACVADSDLITSKLGFPAVNFGFGRHGPLSYLASLKEYGETLRPKTVLWFHYEGNDTYDLEDERRNVFLKRYLDPRFTQRLATRQSEIDEALKRLADSALTKGSTRRAWQRWKEIRPSLGEMISFQPLRRQYASGHPFSPEPLGYLREPDILSTYESVLRKAKSELAPWNGKIVFVYLPEWRTLKEHKTDREDRKKLTTLVGGLGIDFLDMTPHFLAAENPMRYFPYQQFGHYTPEGYGLVAREVANFLRQRSFDKIHSTLGSDTPGT